MEDDATLQLERILSALLNEAEQKVTLESEQVNQALTFLKRGSEAAQQFITNLFPGGVPQDGSFYRRLYRVASLVGFDEAGTEFVGHIWSAALLSLTEPNREKLLRSLPTGHEFFVVLRSFPFVLKTCRFEPSFLIDSLLEVRTRIGNDMAQGPYWRGIEVWAAAFPDDAFLGLEVLLKRNLDDDGISIAAATLGSLRVAWELGNGLTSNHASSEKMAHEPDITKRLIYHRSWINTGWIRGISDAEFKQRLMQMAEGSPEEQAEAFNFLRCLVADGRTGQGSLEFGVAWLTRTAHASLPDSAKHWVCNVAHMLGQRWVLNDAQLASLLPSWLGVQPISFDKTGTWMEIEHLLVELLHKNPSQFERWLLALLDANPAGVIKYFREHSRFEYLCSEMVTHRGEYVAATLFFSTAEHQRQFAFAVYDKVPFDSFPDGILAQRSDNEIALCLFELRRHFLHPEHTARFLIALHQRAEAGGPQLAKLFRDELLYEAKNLPGAVLGSLKRVDKSALVQAVIEEADAYFDKLQTAHRSAINSMEIPGWRRALFIRSRRQSREMEKHKNEFSILSQLVTTSYLIYGNQGFRSSHDGEIGEFAPMTSMSVSIEAPRLAMIDPEGARAREIAAGRATDRLAEIIVKTAHDR